MLLVSPLSEALIVSPVIILKSTLIQYFTRKHKEAYKNNLLWTSGGMALDATDGHVGSKELSFKMNRGCWMVVDIGCPHMSEWGEGGSSP